MNQQTRDAIGSLFKGLFAFGVTNDKQHQAATQAVEDLEKRREETISNTVAAGMRMHEQEQAPAVEVIEVQGEEVVK